MSEKASFNFPIMELSQVPGTVKIVNGPSIETLTKALINNTEVFFIIETKKNKKRYRVNMRIKGIHLLDEEFRNEISERFAIHLQGYRVLSYSDTKKLAVFKINLFPRYLAWGFFHKDKFKQLFFIIKNILQYSKIEKFLPRIFY